MTSFRSLVHVGLLLGAAVWSIDSASGQTTPRTGARPVAPSTPKDKAAPKETTPKDNSAKKNAPVTSTVGSKPATGGTTKNGQTGPVASTKKQNPPPEEEDSPRMATRPDSAKSGDARKTLPATSRVNDLKDDVRAEAATGPLPAPKAPSWHPVPEDERLYIEKVLKYWESETAKISNYRCDFRKYTYAPNFAPANVHYEYSTGQIMYAKPDKGMYRVDEIHRYRPPKEKGGKPEHVKAEGEKGEHWICDGKSVYYFDYLNKLLRKTNLPPEMQGKAIADGPLPFVFGAEAKKIQERYWLKVVTPENAVDEIRLAARPRFREDAANYQEIIIVIDHKEFLPKAMTVFMPNYDAKTNPAKENYTFDKRENNLAESIWNTLKGEFYQPKTPGGWKLEEQEVPREEIPRTASAANSQNKGATVAPPNSTPRRPAAANSKP